MSYKWEDKSVATFLKEYEKYPCLWNSYHENYYNCVAKNEALREIINNLNIPGFTVPDYLQQIKTIREKYAKEQTKTIKGLQSQKGYRSPYPWYEIVARMLTRVINDEETRNLQTTTNNYAPCDGTVLKSLSTNNILKKKKREKSTSNMKLKFTPCVNFTCDSMQQKKAVSTDKIYSPTIQNKLVLRSKKSETKPGYQEKYGSYSYCKKKENILDDGRRWESHYNYAPTKDVELRTGYPEIFPCSPTRQRVSTAVKNGKATYDARLHCPSCGWEDSKLEGTRVNAEKPLNELPIKSLSSVPRQSNKTYLNETYKISETNNKEKYADENAGDFNFKASGTVQDVVCPINNERQDTFFPAWKVKKEPHEEETQLQSNENNITPTGESKIIELGSEALNKLKNGMFVACTRFNIILPNSDYNQDMIDIVNECTQTVYPKSETKNRSVCTTRKVSEATSVCTEFSNAKTKTRCNQINFTPCISLQNFTNNERSATNQSCSTAGNKKCVTRTVSQTDFKQIGVNTVEREHKKIQSAIGGSCRNKKISEVCTTTSSQDNLFVCPAKLGNAIKRRKCVPMFSRKSQELLEPTASVDVRQNLDSSVQEFDVRCTTGTCPENNVFAMLKNDCVFKQFLLEYLYKILFEKCENGVQDAEVRCVSKDPNLKPHHICSRDIKDDRTIDVSGIINDIQKCVVKTLKSHLPMNNFEDEFCNNFPRKCDVNCTCAETVKGQLESKEVQTSDMELQNVFTVYKESDAELMAKPFTKMDNNQQTIEGDLKTKDLYLQDKGISVSSENRDAETNRSLSMLQVQDVGTQNIPQLLNNSTSAATDCNCIPRKTVGTQKRDPILVRVIKCTADKETLIKSDKAIYTSFNNMKSVKHIDKSVDMCCPLNCTSSNTNRTRMIPKCCDNTTNCSTSLLRNESEMLLQQDRLKKLLAYVNHECDEKCINRKSPTHDWTLINADACGNNNVSRIPLCTKKYKRPERNVNTPGL